MKQINTLYLAAGAAVVVAVLLAMRRSVGESIGAGVINAATNVVRGAVKEVSTIAEPALNVVTRPIADAWVGLRNPLVEATTPAERAAMRGEFPPIDYGIDDPAERWD